MAPRLLSVCRPSRAASQGRVDCRAEPRGRSRLSPGAALGQHEGVTTSEWFLDRRQWPMPSKWPVTWAFTDSHHCPCGPSSGPFTAVARVRIPLGVLCPWITATRSAPPTTTPRPRIHTPAPRSLNQSHRERKASPTPRATETVASRARLLHGTTSFTRRSVAPLHSERPHSADVPIGRGLRRWVRVPSALDTRQSTPGPVAQLVSAPPCHGGGRGFESRRGRSTTQPVRTLSEPAFVSPAAPASVLRRTASARG